MLLMQPSTGSAGVYIMLTPGEADCFQLLCTFNVYGNVHQQQINSTSISGAANHGLKPAFDSLQWVPSAWAHQHVAQVQSVAAAGHHTLRGKRHKVHVQVVCMPSRSAYVPFD